MHRNTTPRTLVMYRYTTSSYSSNSEKKPLDEI